MDKSVLLYSGILLFGVFISAISQVMLKKASQKSYNSKIEEYMNPLVIIAYILFIGTTLLSIIAYRGIPLSMGPILETTSYLYVMFFGVKIFKERINIKKILAIILLIAGIIVFSLL